MINETRFGLNKKTGMPLKNVTFCRHPELIENYEKAIADTTQTWEVHHRKEELYSYKELIERGEYYDVEPEELIFLTKAEHCKIDSHCRRHSKAMKGRRPLWAKPPKKVLCIETGEVFESMWEAQRKTGIHQGNISNVCNGKRKTAGGYHWRYV